MKNYYLSFILLISTCFAEVITTTGQIKFDVDANNQPELTFNTSGLGIGTTPSNKLDVAGNAIVSDQLSIGAANGSANLTIHGSVGYNFQVVTSSTTLSGNSMIFADSSNGNLIISLPEASDVPNRKYTIKKTSRDNRVFIRDGGFIDSYSDIMLSTNSMGCLTLLSSSGNWTILSRIGETNDIDSENLLTWFKLDQSTGTSVTDSKNLSRTSAFTGGLNFDSNSIEAIIQGGVDFNGSDYIDIMDDSDLPTGNGDRSIMAWIRPASYSSQQIITWGTETGGQRCEFGLRAGGYLVFAVNGGAYGTTDTPAAGEWFHASIVFSGTNASDILIYINGESKSITRQAGSDRSVNTQLNGQAQIGTAIGRAGSFYQGDIDDVRIYNKAFTADEVLAIYQQGQ